MALLPKNIVDKIEIIHIKNPFKLTADISGKFEHNDNTLVSLNYETVSNEVLYKKDRLNFKGISFKGNTKTECMKIVPYQKIKKILHIHLST